MLSSKFSARSLITDRQTNLIIIIEKLWNIARITKMWHRDTKRANTVGRKMALVGLVNAELPQTFNS